MLPFVAELPPETAMPTTPGRDDEIRDLEPEKPEEQKAKQEDADAVKGGATPQESISFGFGKTEVEY
jgi:hypothetical protein